MIAKPHIKVDFVRVGTPKITADASHP